MQAENRQILMPLVRLYARSGNGRVAINGPRNTHSFTFWAKNTACTTAMKNERNIRIVNNFVYCNLMAIVPRVEKCYYHWISSRSNLLVGIKMTVKIMQKYHRAGAFFLYLTAGKTGKYKKIDHYFNNLSAWKWNILIAFFLVRFCYGDSQGELFYPERCTGLFSDWTDWRTVFWLDWSEDCFLIGPIGGLFSEWQGSSSLGRGREGGLMGHRELWKISAKTLGCKIPHKILKAHMDISRDVVKTSKVVRKAFPYPVRVKHYDINPCCRTEMVTDGSCQD